MATGTMLDSCVPPLMFAIKSDIDATLIGTWIKDIVEECKTYGKMVGNAVLTSEGDKRVTPRGIESTQKKASQRGESPRFLTVSREGKSLISTLISYLYTEVLMGVTYLHHRAYELQDLLILTHKVEEFMSESSKTPPEKLHMYMEAWARQFQLCVSRDPQLYKDFATKTADVMFMVESKSMSRLRDHFTHIAQSLETARIEHGRNESFAIVEIQDVILMKQKDFSYPFDISLLELLHSRRELEQGYARLGEMLDELKKKGTPTKIAEYYACIREKIMIDIRNNLLPALRGTDDRIAKAIEISSTFVSSFADTVTNFIFDLSILYFNYAIAFTDRTTGTTIQLRAEKVVFSQFAATTLFPLPEKLITLFNDITKHAITYGKPRQTKQ
jgi:hypothetical protein